MEEDRIENLQLQRDENKLPLHIFLIFLRDLSCIVTDALKSEKKTEGKSVRQSFFSANKILIFPNNGLNNFLFFFITLKLLFTLINSIQNEDNVPLSHIFKISMKLYQLSNQEEACPVNKKKRMNMQS